MDNSKPVAYLRIGSDKAGTTTIGNLVMRHPEFFTDADIFPFRRNFIHVVDRILKDAEIRAPYFAYHGRVPRLVDESEGFINDYCAGRFNDSSLFLYTEVIWGRCAKNPQRATLSGEILRAIQNWLSNHRLKIILHLRRADLYFESLYGQSVKGGRGVPLEEFANGIRARTFNESHLEFFRHAEEIIGRDNIIIRPFERASLVEGDLIQDLASILGIESVDSINLPTGNERLHRAVTEVIVENFDVGKKNFTNKLLFDISDEIYRRGVRDQRYFLENQLRQEIIAHHEKFYSYLSKHYMGNEAVFREEIPCVQDARYKVEPEIRAFILDRLEKGI
ncbi:hypothetical protein [Paracoccus wurundjeri]|uniref:hypothetical protein n=1 Tax=Paracoccus onubensis TaxID=1675788 RepID=UPI00273095A5|nr:hypothetical protein [Paracoccus onubensis]